MMNVLIRLNIEHCPVISGRLSRRPSNRLSEHAGVARSLRSPVSSESSGVGSKQSSFDNICYVDRKPTYLYTFPFILFIIYYLYTFPFILFIIYYLYTFPCILFIVYYLYTFPFILFIVYYLYTFPFILFIVYYLYTFPFILFILYLYCLLYICFTPY